MTAGLDPLVMFWREWGIPALVVLSLALQVILLVLAEIRRRKDSGVLQVIVWLAYMLADTTVIYVLGHMSVTRRSPEHDLMAFWAPFLLLHLGGQDNITAYSIEDNRLWLRHLQSFVVQVLASAFVLYQSSIFAGGRLTILGQATILMSVVGVVKYGERVWALMCASSSNLSGKNYQSFGRVHIEDRYGRIQSLYEATTSMSETSRAHLLLNIPKHLLMGPLPLVALDMKVWGEWKEMYHVAEIQLSLMYDMFYSKAELIHTWYGYCIRLISLSATITALLLFRRFRDKDGYRYSKVDVAATYVLLVGAVTLEIISALGVMFSTWTYRHTHYNRHFVLVCCTYLLSSPARLLRYAIRKVGGMPARYWSGSMGQHNFINMCSRSKDSRSSKIARWMGREDWWNTLVYTSSSVPVSADFSQLLQDQVEKSVGVHKENPEHIQNSRGRAVLNKWRLYEGLLAWSVDTKMDESILVWHIATHVYLSWYKEKHRCLPHLAKVTEELSNYMIFLLAARPYMLPDNASRKKYIELCNKVINHLEYSSAEDLIRLIRVHGDALSAMQVTVTYADTDEENGTFNRASQLGTMLISKQLETPAANMLELISQVWVEMLCYTGYQCRPDSHARQLSNGGEITTIAVLMVRYMESGFVHFPRINNQRSSDGHYSWWRCCFGLSNHGHLPGRINTIN